MQGPGLLHGVEVVLFAYAGYQVADKRTAPVVGFYVAMCTGKRRALSEDGWGIVVEQAEKFKASVHANVEHTIRVIKRKFCHDKVRYRGLLINKA